MPQRTTREDGDNFQVAWNLPALMDKAKESMTILLILARQFSSGLGGKDQRILDASPGITLKQEFPQTMHIPSGAHSALSSASSIQW